MKITPALYLIALLILHSCGSSSAVKDSIPIDESINAVFRAQLGNEIDEMGTDYVVVIDHAMGKTNQDLESYNFIPNDSLDSFKWSQRNFSGVRFIAKNNIADQKENQPYLYGENIRKMANNGWFEFNLPKFTSDRSHALMEWQYYKSTPAGRVLAVHFYTHLKRSGKRYNVSRTYTVERTGF